MSGFQKLPMNHKNKENLTKQIVSFFTPYIDGVIIEGSSAWGGIKTDHDIDLEFFTANFDFFRSLNLKNIYINELAAVIKNFKNEILDYITALDLKMLSLKIFIDSQEISLRFTKSLFFTEICTLNFEKIKKTKSILQYRLYPTELIQIQRNFSGKKLKYKRLCFSKGNEQLIETPIIIIDKKGKFYPGGIIDRYLSFPKIIYQKRSFCQYNLEKLKINIVKRLIFEEKENLHTIKPSLNLCLSRKEMIPINLLQQLKKEEDGIRIKISKKEVI